MLGTIAIGLYALLLILTLFIYSIRLPKILKLFMSFYVVLWIIELVIISIIIFYGVPQ